MRRHPETRSRRTRRRVLALLPAGPRARLRRLYERTAAPAERATATFRTDGSTLVVEIGNGPAFRLPCESRPAVERQFTEPEAAAELWRFMACAADPGVLFDVGANHGLFALVYCLMGPANKAVAFEPSPRLAEVIRRLAQLNHVEDRLEVVAEAVAESTGVRELLLDERGGYVQSDVFAGTTGGAWRTSSMTITSLDDQMRRFQPTVVKIDIEGYEHEALLGAETLLRDVRPTIFLELHLNYLHARHIAPSTVTDALTRHGYRLVDLPGRRREGREIDRSWASVLHLIATPGAR